MKPHRALQGILLALLTAALLWQCAPPAASVYVKNGKAYGTTRGTFRGRWWNYYERALSYAEGRFYAEAISDLHAALAQRHQDQRMARTYGMHFVDYFPHRELGVILYETGDLQAALRELALSLEQHPSAKAHFYIDRVRKALLQESGAPTTRPDLTLDLKGSHVWTRDDPFVVSGEARDSAFVAGLTIHGQPVFLEGAAERVSFRESLDLPQGDHRVVVAAVNLLGGMARREVVIHVDREGPLIRLASVEEHPGETAREVRIEGSLFDRAGVASLVVEGVDRPISPGVEASFRVRLQPKGDQIVLVARDRLGNRTSAALSLHAAAASRAPLRLAATRIPPGMLLAAGLFGSRDDRPPVIGLKDWTDRQTVYMKSAYLEGEASDERTVESLFINGISVLRRAGQRVFFSHLAELREGENRITIEARDAEGHTTRKTLVLVRKIPRALQLAERLSVTVLPFEHKGALSDASFSFQDNLLDALVERNRFRMIERTRLDWVLQEQKLSRSDLVDRRTALELGRLVAAQNILTGSLVETRSGIEIVGRLIDTETSEIMATEDVYGEDKDLQALRDLAAGMAAKLHRDFPLLDGLVLDRKGKAVFTDLGREEIALGRRLIVYRQRPVKHPLTGRVLGADHEILGRARVVQVMEEISKAQVSQAAGTIRPLDRVLTQ